MHLTSSPIDWYAARAAGIVAYLLLTVGRRARADDGRARARCGAGRGSRSRTCTASAGCSSGASSRSTSSTIAIDSYLPFSLRPSAIPFDATYRPLWTALGIVAAELLLALAITNHYRDRMPYAFWRRAHYLNFAVWVAATLHGLGSGTDRSAPWMLAIFAASVGGGRRRGVWRVLGARRPVRAGHGRHRRGRRRGCGRLRGDRAAALLVRSPGTPALPGPDGREVVRDDGVTRGARLGRATAAASSG